MKNAFLAGLLLSLSHVANASQILVCASADDAVLYYTVGQVHLTAYPQASEDVLDNVEFSSRASEKNFLYTEKVEGKLTAKYARFNIGSTAWCNYQVALPKGYTTQKKPVLFFDANCENNEHYSIRMNCEYQ